MTIIYSITNLINDKRYIGISCRYEDRKRLHLWRLRNNKHTNEKLQNAFNKYGEENFSFDIIDKIEGSDRVKILDAESGYITKFDSFVNGYNKSMGYDGSTLQRRSKQTLDKYRENMMGNKFWLGKKHTEEAKAKIGYANKGKIVSNETRMKISKNRAGKCVGSENHFYGKHHTEETKSILRFKNGKPVVCLETGEEFLSVNYCALSMGLDRRAIEKVCNGKYKSTKGYTFKFLNQ